MKSYLVHYKNKFPEARIERSSHLLNVYHVTESGEEVLLVSLEHVGAQGLMCKQKENGALFPHDLSPLPKEARLWKLGEGDRVQKHEEYEARKKACKYKQHALGFKYC